MKGRREILRSLSAGLAGFTLARQCQGVSAIAAALQTAGQSGTPAGADQVALVSKIGAGTYSLPTLDAQLSLYPKYLGYKVHWQGKVPKTLAEFWEAPQVAGRRAAVFGPADVDYGLLRFIEAPGQPVAPRTTYGWNAFEIRGKRVDDLAKSLEGSPIARTGGPADLNFGGQPTSLRAMQAKGPSGEALIFTQGVAAGSYPFAADQMVGPLFIITLASSDYPRTRAFYHDGLGMKIGVEYESTPRNANASAGAPVRRSKLVSVRTSQHGAIEIDDYPDVSAKRTIEPGSLPPGTCICTLLAPDLDTVARALDSLGVTYHRLDKTPSELPYLGKRALFCRGRSEELVEFVERPEV